MAGMITIGLSAVGSLSEVSARIREVCSDSVNGHDSPTAQVRKVPISNIEDANQKNAARSYFYTDQHR
jgi:hypothetical protein